MKSARIEQETTITLSEVLRMQSWFRSFSLDRNASMTPDDIVLDAKLSYLRFDMEARSVVRSEAIREKSTTRRYRHTGVERRNRVQQVEVTPPKRMVRYVMATH